MLVIIVKQVIKNLYQNSKFKIKNNPGFLTTITRNRVDNSIGISIDNINNIHYLKTIPILINSLLVISQSDKVAETYKASIDALCKKKIKADIVEIDDIVPDAEKPYLENKTINIVDNELVFDDEDENKDLLGLLFNLDSDEEEESEYESDRDESDRDESDRDESKRDESKEKKKSDDELLFGGAPKGPLVIKKDAKAKEDEIKDLTGMSLANPNPFLEKLKRKDPKIFITNEDDKRFDAYSRICPSNVRRQPVILTDKEKDEIDKNHAGSYTEAIKYGSEPDKQYWYICPRYWSLKDNVSLTEVIYKFISWFYKRRKSSK